MLRNYINYGIHTAAAQAAAAVVCADTFAVPVLSAQKVPVVAALNVAATQYAVPEETPTPRVEAADERSVLIEATLVAVLALPQEVAADVGVVKQAETYWYEELLLSYTTSAKVRS